MPDILETTRDGRVLRVALNRPAKRNALNAQLCRLLVASLEDAFLVYRVLSAGFGERRVLEMALTGRVLGALEAKEMGLVQEVVPTPQTRAAEIASAVSEFSPSTIRSGLRFTREVRGQDWEAAGRIARRMRDEVFASSDFEEGLRAFVEKRTPRWPSVHGQY